MIIRCTTYFMVSCCLRGFFACLQYFLTRTMLPCSDDFPLCSTSLLHQILPASSATDSDTLKEPWQENVLAARQVCLTRMNTALAKLESIVCAHITIEWQPCPRALFDRSSWGHKMHKREMPSLVRWINFILHLKFYLLPAYGEQEADTEYR